jgi:hypothetical protein
VQRRKQDNEAHAFHEQEPTRSQQVCAGRREQNHEAHLRQPEGGEE